MENSIVVGYTTGVFDMFHIGHLNILRTAKSLCDYLIVGVSTDELVIKEKHKLPIIPFEQRCAIVESIRFVDKVVPQIDKNKLSAYERLHFDKMFVGSDWQNTSAFINYERQFEPYGVQIIYIPHTDGISSSLLRERLENNIQFIHNYQRGGGRVIGFTSGVFDMFHIGHLNILKQARKQCDFLIVGVSKDQLVQSYKGKTPVKPFRERFAIIDSCKYVDAVISQDDMDKYKIWEKTKFDIMFHGSEWKGSDLYNRYEREFKKVGVKIVYLQNTHGISSTILRNKIFNI